MKPDETREISIAALIANVDHLTREALTRVFDEAQEHLLTRLRDERLPDGSSRFVMYGRMISRTLVTSRGVVHLSLQRVRDKLEKKTFYPLLHALGILRRKYSQELRMACAEAATKASYREAVATFARDTGVMVPARTAWNFVQELGEIASEEVLREPVSSEKPVHLADGTEVRSREKGGHHQVQVSVVQDPATHQVSVTSVGVDIPPAKILEGQNVELLVTDADPAYEGAIALAHGLCLRHFGKYVGVELWKQGRDEKTFATKAERTRLSRELSSILWTLDASVKKHREDKDMRRLEERIRQTLKDLEEFARKLETEGYEQSAKFVRTRGKATVVFAEMAVKGIWMPATTNGIERIMGMIAGRCKRKWAHWGSGLRNMVMLVLTRKTQPKAYERTEAKYMSGVNSA